MVTKSTLKDEVLIVGDTDFTPPVLTLASQPLLDIFLKLDPVSRCCMSLSCGQMRGIFLYLFGWCVFSSSTNLSELFTIQKANCIKGLHSEMSMGS